jgi:SAM-dependent methyltransferase
VETFPRPTDAAIAAHYAAADGWNGGMEAPDYEGRQSRLPKYIAEVRSLGLPPGRVLDFGCGPGLLLDGFQSEGWDTYGVEPAPISAQAAEAHHKLLGAIPGEASFDLVCAFHVLEHLPDPLSAVQRLFGATRPGGHIYVGVPNLDRLPEHGRFRYLLNRQHLYAYTGVAMCNLLNAAGFSGAKVLIEGPRESAKANRRSLRVIAEKGKGRRPTVQRPLDAAINSYRAFLETKVGRDFVAKKFS